ncbi:hypothetical protein A3Q56_05233 [Intoshia linei]|uniref:Uncharacterized protein n=1 Tax=Intoshia linei TaxID=1819745 RepID=A0A177AYV8_9BILA|nr:hypothetical protein A3Q56_05233 [Intoshia linei]
MKIKKILTILTVSLISINGYEDYLLSTIYSSGDKILDYFSNYWFPEDDRTVKKMPNTKIKNENELNITNTGKEIIIQKIGYENKKIDLKDTKQLTHKPEPGQVKFFEKNFIHKQRISKIPMMYQICTNNIYNETKMFVGIFFAVLIIIAIICIFVKFITKKRVNSYKKSKRRLEKLIPINDIAENENLTKTNKYGAT